MNKIIKSLFVGLLSVTVLSGCNSEGSVAPTTSTTSTTEIPSTTTPTSTSSSENPHDRDPNNPYKVLFLGNSLIFFNDMPTIFESLANSQGIPVIADSVTQGSCTMSLLATTATDIGRAAYNKITSDTWDYIIIEPSRRATPFENTVREQELEAAVVLDQLAANSGAETVIYSVWGLNKNETGVYQKSPNPATPYETVKIGTHEITRSAHCHYMAEFGEAVSERLGGRRIIRAGYAFENSIKNYPGINLYHTDEQHPYPTGSYMIACSVYDTLFNERVLGASFTNGVAKATEMQTIADLTMIDQVVPTLDPIPNPDEPTPEEDYDHRVLFIGAPTIMRDDYKVGEKYIEMMASMGKTVACDYVLSSSYTMKMFSNISTEKGGELRAVLAANKYDYIVIQISRRATLNSPEVTAAELSYAEALKPLLTAETSNIFVFAPKGESNQSKFIDTGANYTSNGKDGSTDEDQCHFYSTTAVAMAEKIGGKALQYSNAYWDYKQDYGATKAGVQYLYQTCFYYSFFGEDYPTTCTWTNGCGADETTAIKEAAAKYCLSA